MIPGMTHNILQLSRTWADKGEGARVLKFLPEDTVREPKAEMVPMPHVSMET